MQGSCQSEATDPINVGRAEHACCWLFPDFERFMAEMGLEACEKL
jgi:hypothetical protein